jgi:hypothetical protein
MNFLVGRVESRRVTRTDTVNNNERKESQRVTPQTIFNSIGKLGFSPLKRIMKPKDLEEFEKKNFEATLEKVTFAADRYRYDFNFGPGIPFYKYLSKPPAGDVRDETNTAGRLAMWVPDTIVFNDLHTAQWIFTSVDGYVYRTDIFLDSHIMNQIGNPNYPEELVAVLKRPKYDSKKGTFRGINTTVVNTIDLKKYLSDFAHGEPCAMQKFVRSNGPVAFVCRTVYRREGRPYVWIITNKRSFNDSTVEPKIRCVTQTATRDACTIIHSNTGKYLEQTYPQVQNLVKYLEGHLKCSFDEMVCDFIKDINGRWWFVTCKAFLVNPNNMPLYLNKFGDGEYQAEKKDKKALVSDYERLKRCRLCQVAYPFYTLTHQLTIKMITETDQHLRGRGIAIKWLERSEYRHSDMATLYQSYPVCKHCYRLYELTEELKDMMKLFSQSMGIPSKISYDDIKPGAEMPEDWMLNLPPTRQAVLVVNDQPTNIEETETKSKPLTIFRILVVLKELKEVSSSLDPNKSYYLKFKIFNYKQSFKLRADTFLNRGLNFIPINKIRLFHFYARNRDRLKEYLNENKKIMFKLYCDGEVIGKSFCDISNFHSPLVIHKTYYEVFTGKSLSLGYLKCDIGVQEGAMKDVSMLKLKAFKGLFVPPDDYCFCEPLPAEWLDILPNVKEYNLKLMEDYGITPEEIARCNYSPRETQPIQQISSRLSPLTYARSKRNSQVSLRRKASTNQSTSPTRRSTLRPRSSSCRPGSARTNSSRRISRVKLEQHMADITQVLSTEAKTSVNTSFNARNSSHSKRLSQNSSYYL